MGVFQWLMKKITKAFGRGTNALYYVLLYREIIKEVQEITQDEELTLKIVREIGKKAALDSCERHSGIFKVMPGNPKKVLDYFGILWSVVFGMEFGEHNYEEIPNPGHTFNHYILEVKKCPICAGYGNDAEDTFDFDKISEKSEGMACGLCGMLESVANFILKTKRADYRIEIKEMQCIAKGAESLKFMCKIYNLNEWNEMMASEGKEIEEPAIQDTKIDFFDRLQDSFSLDKLEVLLDKPLENIKEKVAELIRDKLNMEPEHFFDYFRNYEDDMLRILGYLFVHLLNEYGGLIEKFNKSETFAKVSGYIFKHLKEMVLLFIPLDILNDYKQLLINFLEGLAPTEMVDNIRKFSGKDGLNFIFEGAQMALENLGINFEELKENIWEELKKEREDGLISSDQTVIEETQEKFPKLIQIIQEIVMLINEIITLPIRVLISEAHYGVKTAINSVVSEEEGLFSSIRNHADKIFDYIQEIRQ
ncbi:MAG: hypothetical protein ACP6IY_14590 [Promethearchaeia archaeon]